MAKQPMSNKQFTELLILVGGLAFLGGILVKFSGQAILFDSLVYWRFSMGCLALAIALLLQKIAHK